MTAPAEPRDGKASGGAVPRRPPGDVWVYAERGPDHGGLADVAVELLGLARELADALGTGVGAVVLGGDDSQLAAQAIAHGADRVYVAAAPELARFDDERCSAVLARLVRTHRPEILLGGATAIGRALLPRVAILVDTGLTADCTDLRIDPASGLLLQTRPAFGGNILATIACRSRRPQMATVRPAVLRRRPPDPGRHGTVIPVAVESGDLASGLDWLEFTPAPAAGTDLRAARVVVTAGYGVGGPDGVRLVARLAAALSGVLGASRAVVDAGWLPYPHQVGQTGTTVQPDLYVACGVSGAIQHRVGMQNSATIVAINRDADAPILEHADLAVVGDLFEIVPEWLRQLENGSTLTPEPGPCRASEA